MTVASERSPPGRLKAAPTGKPMPLVNAVEVEIPPVITADVIRLVSTMSVIVLNRVFFLFFLHSAHELQFH